MAEHPRLRGRDLRGLIAALALGPMAAGALAQTPPNAAQIARYDGLFRAAHFGDVAEIERLVAAGADVNMQDRAGRTPAHVAAFASNDDALAALAAAGADMKAPAGAPMMS